MPDDSFDKRLRKPAYGLRNSRVLRLANRVPVSSRAYMTLLLPIRHILCVNPSTVSKVYFIHSTEHYNEPRNTCIPYRGYGTLFNASEAIFKRIANRSYSTRPGCASSSAASFPRQTRLSGSIAGQICDALLGNGRVPFMNRSLTGPHPYSPVVFTSTPVCPSCGQKSAELVWQSAPPADSSCDCSRFSLYECVCHCRWGVVDQDLTTPNRAR